MEISAGFGGDRTDGSDAGKAFRHGWAIWVWANLALVLLLSVGGAFHSSTTLILCAIGLMMLAVGRLFGRSKGFWGLFFVCALGLVSAVAAWSPPKEWTHLTHPGLLEVICGVIFLSVGIARGVSFRRGDRSQYSWWTGIFILWVISVVLDALHSIWGFRFMDTSTSNALFTIGIVMFALGSLLGRERGWGLLDALYLAAVLVVIPAGVVSLPRLSALMAHLALWGVLCGVLFLSLGVACGVLIRRGARA